MAPCTSGVEYRLYLVTETDRFFAATEDEYDENENGKISQSQPPLMVIDPGRMIAANIENPGTMSRRKLRRFRRFQNMD
jgi:hypothetical protein